MRRLFIKLGVIGRTDVRCYPKNTDIPLKHRKEKRKNCQPFAKLKEVFCLSTHPYKNTPFNFDQPHPKPNNHSDSGHWKTWGIFDNNRALKFIFMTNINELKYIDANLYT